MGRHGGVFGGGGRGGGVGCFFWWVTRRMMMGMFFLFFGSEGCRQGGEGSRICTTWYLRYSTRYTESGGRD